MGDRKEDGVRLFLGVLSKDWMDVNVQKILL